MKSGDFCDEFCFIIGFNKDPDDSQKKLLNLKEF